MRPSSMKHGYIISHSNGSKSATKSRPPHGGASVEVSSITDFFVFFNFLCGALSLSGFCHRDLRGGVVAERQCRVDELILQDFRQPCGASTIDTRELEASAVSTT
jgi:hypothetical protein